VLYQLSYKGMLAAKYQILRGCKAKIRHLGAEIGVICAGQPGLGPLRQWEIPSNCENICRTDVTLGHETTARPMFKLTVLSNISVD
jgi:hypothetical protein